MATETGTANTRSAMVAAELDRMAGRKPVGYDARQGDVIGVPSPAGDSVRAYIIRHTYCYGVTLSDGIITESLTYVRLRELQAYYICQVH